MNTFLLEAYKYDSYTENGAVSHSTTGSSLLDYFSNSGTKVGRHYEAVATDLETLWMESPMITLQIIFYNRMITRKVKGTAPTETVQRGQGSRHEFRMSLKWLAQHHSEALIANLWLVPEVGCWKDLWHENLLGVLPADSIYDLIQNRLEDAYHRELLAKYLPRIRSKSQATSERHRKLNTFAHGLIRKLGWTPKAYRQFKSSGKAHEFQRLMCRNQWDQIPYGRVPGKALSMMTSSSKRHPESAIGAHGEAERFLHWLDQQPVAKFTGYPHELVEKLMLSSIYGWYLPEPTWQNLIQTKTVDKQFEGLLEKARQDVSPDYGNLWVAIDTSGSMTWAGENGVSAYNIALGLGIYFSALNEGAFQDHIIMFDDVSQKLKLNGSFSEKVNQIIRMNDAMGSTNFQSVIDEIVRIRQEYPEIPVEDFPSSLLVVTDLQFNPAGENTKSNYEVAQEKLAEAGLPKLKIIWWNVTDRSRDLPNQQDDEDVMTLGGFDGAIIPFLMGESTPESVSDTEETASLSPETVEEKSVTPYSAMLKALNQEILTKVAIA